MQVSRVNSNMSFTSYKSAFSQHLETVLSSRSDAVQENLLKIEFKDVFEKHNKKEFSMGAGNFNRVYKIDDFYVMRYPFTTFSPRIDSFRRPIDTYQTRIGKQLKSYYGVTQAEFGEVQILKNACEDKDFVICQTLENIANYNDRVDYFTQKYLPAFASLPQAAYNDLASDLKLMNSFKAVDGRNYCFDILNPRNFIKVGNEIRVVDDIENSGTIYKSGNNLATLLDIFFSSTHGILGSSYSMKDRQNMKDIFIKCIVAAENSGLEWGDYEMIAGTFSSYMKNIGLSSDLKSIKKAVKNIKETDPEKRAKIIAETLDNKMKLKENKKRFSGLYF